MQQKLEQNNEKMLLQDLQKIVDKEMYKYQKKIRKYKLLKDKNSDEYNEFMYGKSWGAVKALNVVHQFIISKL